MATNISKLAVVLTANGAGMKAGLNAAGKDAESFASRIASIAGGMAVYDLAKSAVTSIASGITGLATTAIKLAADAEQAKVAFTTMLGSADLAKQLIAQINSFAAATPFETSELVNVSKNLLAFGVAQEQIVPTMRVLGDLAAGNSEKFAALASIYGKMKTGKITSMDIVQIAERGIPIFDQLATQMGKTKQEIMAMASQGGVSLGDIQTAMIALTSEGGKFHGMMAAQSQTLTGLWSTMQDAVSMALTEIGTMISEKLDMKAAMQSITEAIQTMADLAMPMIEGLIGKMAEIGISGKNSGEVMMAAFEQTSKGIGFMADLLALASAGWHGFKVVALTAIGAIMEGVTAILQGMDYVLEAMGQTATGWGDTAERMTQDLRGQLREEIEKTATAWNEFDKGANSDNVGKFFADVKKKAEEAKAARDALAPSAIGALVIDAAAAGPSKDELKAQQKAAREAMKVQKDLEREAARMFEDTRSEREKYAAQLERINELQIKGFIDQETAARAAAKAREDFITAEVKDATKGKDLPDTKVAALERRFTAGFTRAQDDPQKKMLDEQKHARKAAERTAKNTEAIAKQGATESIFSIAQ